MADKALVKTRIGKKLTTARTLPADQNPALVYLASLGKSSRRTMRQALNRIAEMVSGGMLDGETLDWSLLKYQHTTAIRSALIDEGLAPSTINRMIAALKGVMKECWRLGHINAEDYHKAVDLKSVRGERLPRGRAVTNGELISLFRVCAEDETAAGRRDAALLGVMFGAGLRRAEVVALDMDSYDEESGMLTVREGKGRKDRIGYATNGAADALAVWIETRGTEAGPLFTPISQTGEIKYGRMTAQALYMILRKRAKQAKVADFSPHDARRYFVSTALENGADISAVSALAGHSSVTTTTKYDMRGEKAKKKAAELLVVPFVR